MSGFIKLRRGLRGHWILEDAELSRLFLYLLLEANWQDNPVVVDGQSFILKRGEVLCSERQLARDLRVDRGVIRRRTKTLKDNGIVTQRQAGKWTVISITKYDNAVDCDPETTQKSTGNATRDATRDAPQQKKNKEIKKERYIPPKNQHGDFGNVFLTEKQEEKYRNEYGEAFFTRLVEKLDSWIEQDKTPKRIKNGKNADATFRAWVLNAVSKEQLQAPRASNNQSAPRNLSRRERQALALEQRITQREGANGIEADDREVPLLTSH